VVSSTPLARIARACVPITALVFVALGLGACAKEPAPPKEQIVQGACQTVFGASVCAWDRMAGDSLTAFGATVPMAAIDSAPAEEAMVWPPVAVATIPLSQAARAATGFDNITMYWEAHGHPPAPYLVPHFDFHFNNITTGQIAAIDCADSTKPAQPPSGYELPDVAVPEMRATLIGLCVPHMGMHALPTSELQSTTPFEKTMIVGYYAGKPIFLEPMITRATLDARRGFSLAIPAVPDAPASVHYPVSFAAQYDSTAQAYRFTFSGLSGHGTP
jgi:hypothetical protein